MASSTCRAGPLPHMFGRLRAQRGAHSGIRTAGRDRITISAPRGDPSPIPPELLGAWWRAAGIAPSQVAADYYRFQLLTGCRGIEIHGHKRHGYPPITVGDVDRRAGSVWASRTVRFSTSR